VGPALRFAAPRAGEFGTYFIGYASSPDVIEEMLQNMFIGKPPGNHDRILDFSTAVTGGLFFVPTADFLDNQPAYHAAAATGEPACTDSLPALVDGSLAAEGSPGIGGLRRSVRS
jgi:putative iron-dependent peroxidase